MARPKKKSKSSLTDADWKIMRIIWSLFATPERDQRMGITTRQVYEQLPSERGNAPTTVATVMNRLVGKGFLTREKIGRAHFFTPVVSWQEAVRQEVRRLVRRYSGFSDMLLEALEKKGGVLPRQREYLKTLIEEEIKRQGKGG